MTRRSAIMIFLALGGATFLVSLPAWVTGSTPSVLGQVEQLIVTGAAAAPGVTAAGLAFLAAGIATGLVGRAGRWVVIGVVASAALIVLGSSIAVVRNPQGPLLTAAANRTGVAQLSDGPDVTPWPWIGIVLGVLGLVLAVWVTRSSGEWRLSSRRHERAETPPHGTLSESPDTSHTVAVEQFADSGSAKEPEEPQDPADLWDAQTRGEADQ